MASKTTEWRPGPTVCRCCLTEGCYKDISTEYFWMGKREVYADMLSETFDLSIAYSQSGGPNSHSRLICEPCISRLRDAADFKRQVQECERTFTQYLDPGSSLADLEVTVDLEKEVKVERVKVEKEQSDDEEFDDRPDFGDDDDYDDLDDEPLTKLASKIPKKESVDVLDLIDNAKVSVKRKSSSKTKATPAKKAKTKKDTATSSKEKPEPRKKKGPTSSGRQGVLTSIWEMTISERQNAAMLLENTTIRPFVYCRYFFKCFFCSEEHAEINALLKHSSTHDMPAHADILKDLLPKGKRTVKVDISDLKCKLCSKKFSNLDQIRRHLELEHNKIFTKSGNGIVAYNLSSKDGQLSCHICNKIFQTFILLNRHMNVHFSNAVCETCGAGFMTHQRLIQHKEIHSPGGYPCNRCNKVYTTHSNLKYHIEKAHEGATNIRMLRCPHCPERFSEHFRKLKHLKEVHEITFTYICDLCKSTFPSRRALTTHTNKFHTQKTLCDICKKSFSCITTLKKHMTSHSGVKSYGREKSLKKHVRIHEKFNSHVYCGDGCINKNDLNKDVNDCHSDVIINS